MSGLISRDGIVVDGELIDDVFALTIKESFQALKMRGDNLPDGRIIQDLADRYSISTSEIEKIVSEAPKEETL